MENTLFDKDGIVVYPSRVSINGALVSYADIISIRIFLTNTDTNFFTIKETILIFDVLGSRWPLRVQGATENKRIDIVEIYELVTIGSFKFRLERYLAQVRSKGGFHYGGANFYSSGDVFYLGNTFKLDESIIEGDELILKGRRFWNKNYTISLKKNSDVFLTLRNFFLKNPCHPSECKERLKGYYKFDSSKIISDIVSLAAVFSKSDGVISKEELSVLKIYLVKEFKLSDDQYNSLSGIFDLAKKGEGDFEVFARSLKGQLIEKPERLKGVLRLLRDMAHADGDFCLKEKYIYERVSQIFGHVGDSSEQFKDSPNHNSLRAYYLRLLGLVDPVTEVEIKKGYRKSAMFFHPDRVHSEGEEAIKIAEEKIKLINKAYSYLSS